MWLQEAGVTSFQAGMWVCGLPGPHLRPDLPAHLIPTPVGGYPPCPQGFHSLGAEGQGLLREHTQLLFLLSGFCSFSTALGHISAPTSMVGTF